MLVLKTCRLHRHQRIDGRTDDIYELGQVASRCAGYKDNVVIPHGEVLRREGWRDFANLSDR